MRIVELNPGLRTSALGFGCAPILGSVDAATARLALTAALDAGIMHFDLARSYGYGQAERFVGRFLGARRDQVTIATKFGIEATPLATLLAPVKPLLRTLRGKRARSPAPAPVVGRAGMGGGLADRLHRRFPITPERLRSSLETSLRELGTDYVDVFFAHEPVVSISAIEDVVAAADRLRTAGKIRAFGLAFAMAQRGLHERYGEQFAVLQFDNSPSAPHYAATVAERAHKPNVFFSPFRLGCGAKGHADVLRQMGRDFPRSVILSSMFRPTHIKANAAACN